MIETLKILEDWTGLLWFSPRCSPPGNCDFWNDVRPARQATNPEVLFWLNKQRTLHEHDMDITYGWELQHIFNQVAQEKASVKEIVNTSKGQKTTITQMISGSISPQTMMKTHGMEPEWKEWARPQRL
jgi:hypothetical protein